MALRARLARVPPGYQFSIGRVLSIYAGLMTVILLASLDQTIVSTSLPAIVSDLGGLTQYTWVFTAYMLATTVTVPIYGKLGDAYGRRPLFFVAISIFLAGSLLCGLAQNMTELVAARGVQGLGAGGLFPLALATIGVIVPPRDRGRYQGLIGAVFASSSILGPLIGGLIVDNASWRWVFLLNVPLCVLAFVVISLTMPRRSVRRAQSIDWIGAALLAGATSALLLGLVWGGRQYAWDSPHVVVALTSAGVLAAMFGFWERRVGEPILPFSVMRDRNVAASLIAIALVGAAMFGAISFVPLYVQGVIGTSATSSGVVLTPLMLGATSAGFLSGQWISRSGRTRPNALVGPVVLTTGMFLLSQMTTSTSSGQAARNMVIAGIGLGLMMQVFVISVQNAVPRSVIGAATAVTHFSRSIGATIGVTIMGVLVNQGLPEQMRGSGELIGIHRLPLRLRDDLADALHPAFVMATLVSALVWFVVFFGMREVPLRRSLEEHPVAEELAAAAPDAGSRLPSR